MRKNSKHTTAARLKQSVAAFEREARKRPELSRAEQLRRAMDRAAGRAGEEI